MKRKGRKNEIPDFSSKRKPAPGPATGVPAVRGPGTAPPPAPTRVIKPHSTSAKSGRRGS